MAVVLAQLGSMCAARAVERLQCCTVAYLLSTYDLSQRIESLVQRVVPARLFSGLAEIANFAEFGTKKIKLKSSNFENFKCLHIYWEI